MKTRYGEPSIRISITTIDREHIFRWGKTRRSHERFSRRKWGPSWRYRRSVDCTTATNGGLPERAIHQAARPRLGALKPASELCSLAQACIGEFGSPDSSRAADCSRLAVRLEGMTSAIGCTEFSVGTVSDLPVPFVLPDFQMFCST